jgi:hypothetical protein
MLGVVVDMEKKNMIRAGKFLALIAVVVCLLSFVVPWTGFSFDVGLAKAGVAAYPWGVHLIAGTTANPLGISASGDVWFLFYYFATGSIPGVPSLTSLIGTSSILLILLSLAFLIVSLIVGSISIFRGTYKRGRLSLIAGIALILSIIIFYGGFTYASTATSIRLSLQWSTGIYLAGLSMILFFVSFVVLHTVKSEPVEQAIGMNAQVREHPVA